MEFDRRHMLLGSGLAALTLAACREKGEPGNEARVADPEAFGPASMTSFDRAWNHGDGPWDPNPAGDTFASSRVGVLHLDLSANPFKLIGRRAHFDTAKPDQTTLEQISDRVIEVINYFNSNPPAPPPTPTPPATPSPAPSGTVTPAPPSPRPCDTSLARPCYIDKEFAGLRGFGFLGPQHVVIYVKNPEIRFNQNSPVWFGTTLIEPDANGSRAAKPNRSFFRSALGELNGIRGGSQTVIYLQNHFMTANEPVRPGDQLSHRRPIEMQPDNNLFYSLNINAVIDSSDASPIGIPLIIDPDTGNMGGGGSGSGGGFRPG